MTVLYKQLIDDDGVPIDEPVWHYASDMNGNDLALLCTGEFVHHSATSGNGSEYLSKQVKPGGITCEKCLTIIREIKAIKL